MEQYLSHLKPTADVRADIINEVKVGKKFTSGGIISTMATCCSLIQISGKRLVKFGSFVSLEEGAAMEFIRQKAPTIPVLKVHFAFSHDSCCYIVMDLIEGQTLSNAQLSLSDQQLLQVATQLREIIAALQEAGGKGVAMGSWPKGPFRNLYFRDPPPSHEFHNMQEFKQYWLSRNRKGQFHVPEPDVDCVVDGQIVLAHGDLTTRNILVKDGVIVAILDWETLGWYPSFWEYTFCEREAWYRRWAQALHSVFGPISQVASYYSLIVGEAIFPRE